MLLSLVALMKLLGLQDAGIEAWCSKLAKRFMKFGTSVFEGLGKGLGSKSKRISRDCLTALTWLGGEVAKSSEDLQHYACEVLLSKIEQHVHPGVELEERLLACLCIYNYTLGRGNPLLYRSISQISPL